MRAVTLGCVGDLHGRLDRLERVARWLGQRAPDGVLLTGDFGRSRDRPAPHEEALRLLEPLGVPVLLVPGNHDAPDLEHRASVDGRLREVAGVSVFGVGGSPRTPARLPYEWTDEELADLEVPSCEVVLSHAPPADTELDRMHDGRHVGSRVVRRITDDHEGALVCGHVHEAASAEVVGACLCYNAGSLGAFAGRAQAGLLVRIPGKDRGWRVEHHHLDGHLDRGPAWSAEAAV